MRYAPAILSIVSIVVLLGCEKERLPKPSQRGRNIVAWRTDGEAYIAKGKALIAGKRASYTLEGNMLRIWGSASSGNSISLRCRFEGLNTPLLLAVNQPILAYGCDNPLPADCSYETKSGEDGSVTVTHYDGDIIAGTFQAIVRNEAGDVLHITDGRFDIRSD